MPPAIWRRQLHFVLWIVEALSLRPLFIKTRLRETAATAREKYIGKPVGRNNVAVVEYWPWRGGKPITAEAISKVGGPIDIPVPRSQGGLFEPSTDPVQQRSMNTDSEYKVLSYVGHRLLEPETVRRQGTLYLYTELQPCQSCSGVIEQFQELFPGIRVLVFFDHPYPPSGK